MANENNTKREIAERVLRAGEATPAELARAMDLSRQLVRYWAEVAAIDWQAARDRRLRRLIKG